MTSATGNKRKHDNGERPPPFGGLAEGAVVGSSADICRAMLPTQARLPRTRMVSIVSASPDSSAG